MNSCIIQPYGRNVTAASGLRAEMTVLAESRTNFLSCWAEVVFGGFFQDSPRLQAQPSAPTDRHVLVAHGYGEGSGRLHEQNSTQ